MEARLFINWVWFVVWGMVGYSTPGHTADDLNGKKWSDEAELSFVSTGGNSNVETLSARNLYKLRFTDQYTFIWRAESLRGRTEGRPTAGRYTTDLRLEYALSHRAYFYSSTGWLRDNFAGPDTRVNLSVGGGYKFVHGPRSFLKLESGVNLAKERYLDANDRRLTEGRFFGEYIYAFTKKNKFSQSLESLHDLDDSNRFRVNSETALIAVLNHRFSLKVSYRAKYNNEPVPATLDKRDRIVSTAIVANF